MGLVAWPLNESETGVEQTSLPFLYRFPLISMRTASLTLEKQVDFGQNKVNSSTTFIQKSGK